MLPSSEDYLSRCVVDSFNKKFYLYSTEGRERVVECETIDQFTNVLEVVRTQVHEDYVAYTSPM